MLRSEFFIWKNEKAGQHCLLTGLSIFGDPFGSPIPQRPQPLDLLLRVGESIHKNGRAGNPLSSNISFSKLCDQPVDRMID
jgi:hypothetical protein